MFMECANGLYLKVISLFSFEKSARWLQVGKMVCIILQTIKQTIFYLFFVYKKTKQGPQHYVIKIM